MSQLIALIIAIALGAIVTAIGYVFLGDAFTSNSERGVALQMVNQGSQVEMAMTAFRAENAASSWNTDQTGTFNNLINNNFLKDIPVSPVVDGNNGAYVLSIDADENVFLSVIADVTLLSNNVCSEIQQLAGKDGSAVAAADLEAAVGIANEDEDGSLGNSRYGCFDNGTTGDNVFVYKVE